MRSVKYNLQKNIIGLSERGDPVSKVRQVLYLVLECCIFAILALVPGVFVLQKYSGWTAQIIQHECDHLNGIII